jgi:membrane protein required for beta-lactamase induction
MIIIREIWNLVRGMTLLMIVIALFGGVILVSCLARLWYGAGYSDVAGKLRLGC